MKILNVFLIAIIIALLVPRMEAVKKPSPKHKLQELQDIVEYWTISGQHQPIWDSVDAIERETDTIHGSGVEDQWAYIKEFIEILITEIEE